MHMQSRNTNASLCATIPASLWKAAPPQCNAESAVWVEFGLTCILPGLDRGSLPIVSTPKSDNHTVSWGEE